MRNVLRSWRRGKGTWTGLFVLAMLALGALACNLSASPPTPTPRPLLPTATPFTLPTATPAFQFPTLTPRPIVPTSPPVIVTPCTQRQDWTFIYTVQTGDYLASIANRAGTTVNEVTAANCLANPNFIAVGQRLRLPRQPVPPSPTPNLTPGAATWTPIPGGVPTIQGLRVDPSIPGVGNSIQIGIGQVQISAVNVTNAVRVTFYIANTGQNPTILGDDTDARDGWAVPYTNLSSSLNAQIWAIATSATGQTAQTPSYALVFAANTAPTIGALSISPSTTNPDGSLGIRPGQLTVSAAGVQNATRVQFFFAPNITGAQPQMIGETATVVNGTAAVLWPVSGPPSGVTTGLIWAIASNAAGQTAYTASTPVTFLQ